MKMSSVQEMQKVDRELFLELIESPINPAFLHISTPLKHCDPMFFLQINGEALWQWRAIKNPVQMFQVLQDNLLQLGFRLSLPCRSRVGILVYGKVNYLTKTVRNVTNNTSHHALRSNYWCMIALKPDDIDQGPEEIIASLKETEQELVGEKQKLTKDLEGKNNKRQMQLLSMYLSKGKLPIHDRTILLDIFAEKASELCNAMMELKESQNQSGHKGKTIDQVGRRQQQRHLKDIRYTINVSSLHRTFQMPGLSTSKHTKARDTFFY